jgi:N-hydroxyarylamine O-acetyltransferase
MLLKVELPGQPQVSYFVDAGFGGQLLGAPLRLEPGLEQPIPGGRARVVRDVDTYAVETATAAGWAALYRCTLQPHLAVDYLPLNWYTATHPSSIFRHNLLLERLTAQHRVALLNDRLTVTPFDGPLRQRRIASAAEFGDVLDQLFDIEPPLPVAELFERVPKGLDGAFLPSPPAP